MQFITLNDGLAISRYEVPFEQYDAFARATGRPLPDDASWGRGRRPVINVTRHEAAAFAEWLSGQLGRPCRLPTEAEWEHAARAGDSGDYGLSEDGEPITAENLGDYAWYAANSGYRTREVGSRKPNALGLHDMLGNVKEWCGPNGRLCGGAWSDDPAALRTSARAGANPLDRDINIGFRVVCLPYRLQD